MIPVRWRVIGGALLALILLFVIRDSCAHRRDQQAVVQGAIYQGEADAHAQAAQAIPDHSAERAQTQAETSRAWAEVARLRKLVAAQPHPTPAPVDPAAPVAVDHRDELLAADAVLIQAQAAENGVLKVALKDMTTKASENLAAFQAERRRAEALQAALSARPAPRNWSAGIRIETQLNGSRQIGATARRDLGPGFVEVSGFSNRAGIGFGWRW